jgi:hypothetical protein
VHSCRKARNEPATLITLMRGLRATDVHCSRRHSRPQWQKRVYTYFVAQRGRRPTRPLIRNQPSEPGPSPGPGRCTAGRDRMLEIFAVQGLAASPATGAWLARPLEVSKELPGPSYLPSAPQLLLTQKLAPACGLHERPAFSARIPMPISACPGAPEPCFRPLAQLLRGPGNPCAKC